MNPPPRAWSGPGGGVSRVVSMHLVMSWMISLKPCKDGLAARTESCYQGALVIFDRKHRWKSVKLEGGHLGGNLVQKSFKCWEKIFPRYSISTHLLVCLKDCGIVQPRFFYVIFSSFSQDSVSSLAKSSELVLVVSGILFVLFIMVNHNLITLLGESFLDFLFQPSKVGQI